MAETKVKNRKIWQLFWALVIVGAVFSAQKALRQASQPVIKWEIVPMDGHRSGAEPLTTENLSYALGSFTEEGYVAPSSVVYPSESSIAAAASILMEVQPALSDLKQVIGHSAREMANDRDNPDLPLGNLFADVLRSYGSSYFKVPMDFSVVNFGGIRIPMPEGAVTLEDISAMFPFKNYLCYCKIKGENLRKLLDQLSGMAAFQATSGAVVRVKDHKLVSALIGGKEIDPERIYNVSTIDFLLDGGDQLRIGALSEDVTLTHVLLKDIMLEFVKGCEARGEVIDARSDGRVIME